MFIKQMLEEVMSLPHNEETAEDIKDPLAFVEVEMGIKQEIEEDVEVTNKQTDECNSKNFILVQEGLGGTYDIKVKEESSPKCSPEKLITQPDEKYDIKANDVSILGISKNSPKKKKKPVRDNDNRGRKRRDNVENRLAMCRGKKVYPCERCEFIGSKPCRLKMHVETVHEKKADFHCLKCEYKATQKGALQRHLATVHEGRKDYTCTVCSYRAGQKNHLVKHLRVHGERKCEQCGYITRSREELRSHITEVHGIYHHCPTCPYKTTKKRDLVNHVMCVHERRRDFGCSQCEYRAGRKIDLRQHILVKHERRSNFTCTMCSYKTTRIHSLRVHTMAVHEGKKPYACRKCDFDTDKKIQLTRHIAFNHTDKTVTD